MATRIHLLTAGCLTPGGRGLLFPLLRYRSALRERGLDLQFFFDPAAPGLTDCDLLAVDSKVHRSLWITDAERVRADFEGFQARVGPVIFFDTGDSSGWLVEGVLPWVRLYCKNHLLRDRTLYGRSLYGNRLFTDHYHRRHGLTDHQPEPSQVIDNPHWLAKLWVSWHSGLCDYSRWGPLKRRLYRHLGWSALLQPSDDCHPPDAPRPLEMSCRINTRYQRETIAWQRQQMVRILAGRVASRPVSRAAYLRELRQARLVISPFGWGEVALRDFETFLAGAVLLKPDMSHLETWPPLYEDGVTLVAHRWDLDDLEERIADILTRRDHHLEIARAGQERYCSYLFGPGARDRFCARFQGLVTEALTSLLPPPSTDESRSEIFTVTPAADAPPPRSGP
ncbi:MAG: glycosyltransferase family 1 protein [Magnetococcales bacterium]|nr:glycosyltransferase family 1 protein [Magnetococcales bacterium]